MMTVADLDRIVARSLRDFAAATLDRGWLGKEHDWVNRYVHGFLMDHCSPAGPMSRAQIGIEVGVAQPKPWRGAVRRDVVIWPRAGDTCWDQNWRPKNHPIAIQEWKVHRPRHRNPALQHQHDWLRKYTAWQREVVAYAIEVDTSRMPSFLRCVRFHAGAEDNSWLRVPSEVGHECAAP